jgi:hypothetical protein
MANVLHGANILRFAAAILTFSFCVNSLLNRNISNTLQRGLSAIQIRPLRNFAPMASTEPQSEMQAQPESLVPPQLQSQEPQELPKLSPADFKSYNRMAVVMDRFVSPEGLPPKLCSYADSFVAQSFQNYLELHVHSMRK